ncbi:MAG: hypothetical protein BWY73_01162 [candidate division TA06 bacterium ADurb.Bin417]|uniref:Uncharacterized protein n=1 Tax=candidate division TA06 bacterium ADurb.Bin417 TaxID=1852828 RepID=A0A1V5MDE5_UNCT6|nr:MAG: hypothetical protein BWY73_01162 [candidate division TA06 bacterium ADurb.Bin417]
MAGHPLQGLQLVPQAGRPLEFQPAGGLGHGRLQFPDQRRVAPLEEGPQGPDGPVVFGRGDQAGAGRQAAAQAVVKAGPDRPGRIDAAAAGGDRKDPAQVAQRAAQGPDIGEGSVIFAAGPGPPAHQRQGGKGPVAQAEKGETLVVLEVNVVMGLVGLDEPALQEEGLGLAGQRNGFEVGDLGYQAGGLGIERPAGLKVGLDPLTQGSGLADVKNPAVGGTEDVNARAIREFTNLRRKASGRFLFRPDRLRTAGSGPFRLRRHNSAAGWRCSR